MFIVFSFKSCKLFQQPVKPFCAMRKTGTHVTKRWTGGYFTIVLLVQIKWDTPQPQIVNIKHIWYLGFHIKLRNIQWDFFSAWHKSRQDSQLTMMISLHICFSIKVTFDHTSIREISCLWNRQCKIITTNVNCSPIPRPDEQWYKMKDGWKC